MATLEGLEQRLTALEQEVSRLKAEGTAGSPGRGPAEESLGEELIRQAQEGRADFAAGWRGFMQRLGIQGEPIGAKQLRQLLLQDGINPEDNEFSRGIIAMREE